MADREGSSFPDQARFMGYAVRVMRGLIIDHARNHHAQKRGGLIEITSFGTEASDKSVDHRELSQISEALDELALKIVTGDDGLDRTILRPRVQKPGLAFAGYYEYIKPWRVQIIGESETKYLESLPARLREKRVRDVAALDVSCFIVTKGITPLEELTHECEKRSVPLFSTPAMSSTSIESVLTETRNFAPPAEFAAKAHVKSFADYEALYARAAADPDGFWAEVAREPGTTTASSGITRGRESVAA